MHQTVRLPHDNIVKIISHLNINFFTKARKITHILSGFFLTKSKVAAQSYATARINSVARAFDATSNDVILAMVVGALRKYLKVRNELPEMPLLAAVPVSVRGKGAASDAANEVAFAITNLATNIADPVERMWVIKRSMDYIKVKLNGLSSGQIQAYVSLSLIPGAVNVLFGRKPDNTLVNVCVSHVPGPKETLYWQGAKLTGLHPISLVIHRAILNITIISRNNFIDFGIIACRRTVPHVQKLLDYLEEALSDLERLSISARRNDSTEAAKKPESKRRVIKLKAAIKNAPAKKTAAVKSLSSAKKPIVAKKKPVTKK
ncbi:MAG: diacylglycerol O-acyltransferase [Neolewinella sp.]|jgi:diacylglycerol O-acyltransferase